MLRWLVLFLLFLNSPIVAEDNPLGLTPPPNNPYYDFNMAPVWLSDTYVKIAVDPQGNLNVGPPFYILTALDPNTGEPRHFVYDSNGKIAIEQLPNGWRTFNTNNILEALLFRDLLMQ